MADVASLRFGLVPLGFFNYVFVWGTVHQLGYAWLNGRLGGPARRLLLAAGGLAPPSCWWSLAPIRLPWWLDTAEGANSYPPRVTLVALGLFQAGSILAFESGMRR